MNLSTRVTTLHKFLYTCVVFFGWVMMMGVEFHLSGVRSEIISHVYGGRILNLET